MKTRLLLLASLTACVPAFAQDGPRLPELERKLDLLEREIEALKLGDAPKASPRNVSLGGYGELVYRGFSRREQSGGPSGKRKEFDLQRFVLYAGYKFDDWILFNSEIEFEHAGSGEGDEVRGEVAIEQAYVEFRPWRELGARVGHLLAPLGLVNVAHEPTAFHGVNRPGVETLIIPSTWHENGAGLFGEYGPVSFQSYALAALSAAAASDPHADGFTAGSAIRGGRTEGSNSPADDLAWASRVDVSPMEGVKAGAGLYLGRADHGASAASVPVTLWETHAEAQWRGASARALYAEGTIGNADALNVAQGIALGSNASVGRRLFGGYIEAAFDALTLVPASKGQALSPFIRYERFDTQWKVPTAYAKNPANSRTEYTLGLTYKPIPKLALKLDQQWKRNGANTGVNQWNLGLGYIF